MKLHVHVGHTSGAYIRIDEQNERKFTEHFSKAEGISMKYVAEDPFGNKVNIGSCNGLVPGDKPSPNYM